jgi:MFS family permease
VNLGLFEVLRYRDFRLLWLGLLVSNLGTWAQLYAEQWYIYSMNQSSLQVGLLVTVQALPNILFYVIGGVFADRFDRKKLLFFTQGTMALITLIIAVLVSLDWATLPIYLTLNFLYGLLIGFDIPARKSIVPNIVPKEKLSQALALYNATFQSALFVGPVLGAFVVTSFGYKYAFYFNALTFLTILWAIRQMNIPENIRNVDFKPTLLRDLKQVFHVIAQDRILSSFLLISFLFYVFGRIDYLFPAIATELLGIGVDEANWLNSSLGVGQIIGSFLLGWWDRPLKQRLIYLFLFHSVWLGISALAVAHSGSLLLASSIILLRGLFSSCIGILTATVIQTHTPNESLGRVMGVQTAMLSFANLASFPLGYLVDRIGVDTTLQLMAISSTVCLFFLLLRYRTIHNITAK